MAGRSPEPIRRVCVIGAGTMGAGIAAQVANSGTPVLLLDIAAASGARDAIAAGAVARMTRAKPSPLMSAAAARLIETGNVEDDLGRIGTCDWVIEAILERLDAKRALYARIDAVRRPGTAVSSNTSTIPLRDLVAGTQTPFARDFLITHFFNPPRQMRLLELVAGSETDPALAARVADFADRSLGKSVVRCKDSPGFIANRLGTYWLQLAAGEAIARGLAPEIADAINGAPFGIPRTGVFGLMDLVGLDLMPHIEASLLASIGPDDPIRTATGARETIARMVERGLTGRKAKGGFYRRSTGPDGRRARETIDVATLDYRPEGEAAIPGFGTGRVSAADLLASDGPAGRYAWAVFGPVLAYAARIIPEAADGPVEIDTAMRLGYNWTHGPFELIDRIGVETLVGRLRQDGIEVPPLLEAAAGRRFYSVEGGAPACRGLDGVTRAIPRAAGVLLLEDVRRGAEPLARNGSSAVWDLGDGALCLEIISKAATLDDQVIKMLDRLATLVPERHRALVICHDGKSFSAGANLAALLFSANIAAWSGIEATITAGQRAMLGLKRAPFPVVSAAFGMALGGGCELLLHSDAIQAHAETCAGLVETGVGLIPGWGGCKEMLLRTEVGPAGPMGAPLRAFELIGAGTVSGSAAEAREHGILRAGDGITMNRDRLLADAKARALALADGYRPPAPAELRLPGPSGRLALELRVETLRARGLASAHDATIARELAWVLTGGETDITRPMTEEAVLDLERQAFVRLLRTTPTLARIEHMLQTRTALRN